MKNAPPKKPSHAGFSLAETSIAAGIVSFALLPLIGLLGVVATNEKRVKDETSLLVLVENITKTLHRESSSIQKFIWHFPASDNSPLEVNYPSPVKPQSEFYLIADDTGLIVKSVGTEPYKAGISNGPLHEVFLIKVKMEVLQSGMSEQFGAGAGTKLEVTVETPIGAGEDKRKKDLFRVRLD